MKRTLLILDLIVLVFAIWQILAIRSPKKILFIGNSYTYENEMPDMFEHIAISKGKNVFVSSVTKGKATLLSQSKRAQVYKAIRKKKWDYVVIQGYSRDMLADDSTMINKTLPALEKIMRAIRRNNSRTKILLFMTWGYRNGFKLDPNTDTYEEMTLAIKRKMLELKKKYRVPIVPVGMAWRDSRNKRADLPLYVEDGAHPNENGSYLAACTFFSAIFNESSVGSAYYHNLSPELCFYLQSVASKNVQYQRKLYGLTWLD